MLTTRDSAEHAGRQGGMQIGRVLHVISGLNTGGAERMLCKIIARSRNSEFEHIVLVLGRTGPLAAEIEANGSEVIALNLRPKSMNLDGAPLVLRTVARLAPTVVQGWMYHGNAAALVGATLGRTDAAIVWNIRSGWQRAASSHFVTRAVMRGCAVLSPRADTIIYNSHRSRQEHEARGYSKRASLVIPNGFDTTNYLPSHERYRAMREELGLGVSTPIIGIIARNDAAKDYTTFFRAVRIAAARNRDIHWVVIGRNISAQSVEVVSAGASPFVNRVSFLGERRMIEHLAPGFDVATLSSYTEGFPNVIGEAMACGVPCVVTDAGDTSLVVGDTGITVPIRDPEALAEGWLRLVNMGSADRAALGAAARKRVIANFELSSICEQYTQLYRGLASR